MTYDESTLFMKFMQGKGVMNNFEYLYRSHRFDKKKDLEQYMDEVAAEDAVLSAFDMAGAGNTIFGVKYWQEIDQKWQAKLTEFRNTGILTADELQVYCPHCQRVLPRSAFATKSNGVLHKHCRECEGGKWDRDKKEREKAEKEAEKQAKAMKQLEKEIAEKQAKLDKLSGKADKDKEIEALAAAAEEAYERTEQEAETEAAAKPKPIKPDKLVAPKLGEYDATLHYKQNQKSLTLNATLSAQIRKGEFSKCYLNIDRSKHAFLIFNRVEGANVTGASTLTQTLLNVTSADIARTLAARFDLDLGDNYYLHITKNLSKKDEFLTVEVLQARSREEYIKIAERRELAAKGKIPPYEAEEEPAGAASAIGDFESGRIPDAKPAVPQQPTADNSPYSTLATHIWI